MGGLSLDRSRPGILIAAQDSRDHRSAVRWYAVKAGVPIAGAGRAKLAPELVPEGVHTHHALDDAREQAEIFGRVFEWDGAQGRSCLRRSPEDLAVRTHS